MQFNTTTFRTTALAFLIAGMALLSSCKEKVTEPEFTGRYFIENNTGLTLKVQAKNGSEFVVLQNSQIAPYAKEKIYDAESQIGTNISPSLFFTEFRVFINNGLKDSTLYNRVRNSDWEEGATTEEYQELTLSVPL